MGSRVVMFLAAAVVLLAAARVAESAVSCSQVYGELTPCVNTLLYGGSPTSQCCQGIQTILGVARNSVDRQAVCNCLKSAAQGIPESTITAAASIPKSCHINIPYRISPSVDCSRIG